MGKEDRNTIIPEPLEVWPLELVIADQLQREIENEHNDGLLFDQLELERAYRWAE